MIKRKVRRMDNENMAKVIETLKRGDNFMISAHMNPEGDSIGSQLAVYHMLKKIGKKCLIVNQDDVPDNLKFLAGTETIVKELPVDFRPDMSIVLDSPVLERIGSTSKYVERTETIINVDHHISNEFFGDVNWVEPKCSSVGEMAYYLVSGLGIELDEEIAASIYTSIVTDTGMFSYANTSKNTHEITSVLLGCGINSSEINAEIFENKSISEIKLLRKVLETLKIEENGKFAYITLTRDMCEDEGEDASVASEFINYPRSIKGVEVSVFFKENLNSHTVNISFRSAGNVNVNTIASRLGGGGHKRASGCLMIGSLKEAREKVLFEIRKALDDDKE